jgi:tRNA (guanine-N7-)-methyltransferase
MPLRVRQHVNPFSLNHLETRAERISLPANQPVEVELGCAEGDFLFRRARIRPDGHYLGIEIRQPLADKVNARAESDGFPQVQAVYANLLVDLERLLSPVSVDAVHVLFPDPWFKRRHRKRRVLNRELAVQLARILKPGGLLFFQSDVFELALNALATLESLEVHFKNRQGPWKFLRENPFGARSRREDHCLLKGIPIWRLLFEKPLRPGSSQ